MAESHGDKATSAHTQANGREHAFPPFQKDTFAPQLVSLAIAFVAPYPIVSKIALPRVGSVLDERQGKIDGDLEEAHKRKDASHAALTAYQRDRAARRT